jgi:hypothetical protein
MSADRPQSASEAPVLSQSSADGFEIARAQRPPDAYINGFGVNIHTDPDQGSTSVGQGEDGNPMYIDDAGYYTIVPDCGSDFWSHGVVVRTDLPGRPQITGWVSRCYLRNP